MAKMVDPLGHHDWESSDYVSGWAKRQEDREAGRQEAFRVLAETIPYDKKAAIKILDLGAGYGGLTQFLLRHFPNATAVCQDGSKEMAKLGRERMKDFAGRFSYVVCDFSKPGWRLKLKGQFEAVVSSIAIHNVRDGKIIGEIYREAFSLVKPGGCFLNFDRQRPPLNEQLEFVKAAGFRDVNCFWKDEKRAVFGGFRR
jgi:ubiquinone/menaquinone biosynthesis C-methylase UbiE